MCMNLFHTECLNIKEKGKMSWHCLRCRKLPETVSILLNHILSLQESVQKLSNVSSSLVTKLSSVTEQVIKLQKLHDGNIRRCAVRPDPLKINQTEPVQKIHSAPSYSEGVCTVMQAMYRENQTMTSSHPDTVNPQHSHTNGNETWFSQQPLLLHQNHPGPPRQCYLPTYTSSSRNSFGPRYKYNSQRNKGRYYRQHQKIKPMYSSQPQFQPNFVPTVQQPVAASLPVFQTAQASILCVATDVASLDTSSRAVGLDSIRKKTCFFRREKLIVSAKRPVDLSLFIPMFAHCCQK